MNLIKKIINCLLVFSFAWSLFILPIKAEEKHYGYVYGTTNNGGMNVRDKPTTSGSNIVGSGLAEGESVVILEETPTTDSCGSWYKIEYSESSNGYGYVCKTYIQLIEISIDPNYDFTKELAKFPESYRASLTELHIQHPSWKFYALQTGLSFTNAVNAESRVGVKLTDTSNDGWRSTSTASNAYDWRTNTWKGLDGSNWKAAHPDLVAYYMDPRNFLDEKYIFMFEDLLYHDYQGESGISIILNNTFMSGTYPDSNKVTRKYSATFVEAGKNSKVSPYHLAARVKQEVVKSGGAPSGSASGVVKGYEGYYNFFNVNAWASGGLDAVQNGLLYAKKMGWTSPYESIIEGASFLGNKYVLKGQNTLFFQNYNISPLSDWTTYTHQYMTNVAASASEASTTYNAYSKSGNLEKDFVFYIPIFEEGTMKASYPLPNAGNPNNWLSDLKINNETIPYFDGETTNYSYHVPSSVNEITISANPVTSKASVNGTGNMALKVGENKIPVVVTAQNGDKRTYNLIITKADSAEGEGNTISVDDIIGKIGVKTNGSLMNGIKLGTSFSSFRDVVLKHNNFASVVLKDKNGTTKNTTFATGDSITITSGLDSKTYQILLLGDLSGDGNINLNDLLLMQKIILKQSNLSGVYLNASDINKDGKTNLSDLLFIQKHILGTEIQQ